MRTQRWWIVLIGLILAFFLVRWVIHRGAEPQEIDTDIPNMSVPDQIDYSEYEDGKG